MHNARGHIQRHTGLFTHAGKEISFAYWSHTRNGQSPDTIIFLGTGQTGSIPRWAARHAPVGVIVIEGAPHWHAHPSAHDLYDFMYAYTVAAFHAACQTFALTTAHIVAQSQAAPGGIRLGNAHPANIDNIVLMSPLGFTAHAFGSTPDTRARTLLKRALRTLAQPTQSPLHDPRNLYAGYKILRAILRESERGASKRKYAAGLAHDMTSELQTLLGHHIKQHKMVSFVLGGKDRIFKTTEIQSALTSAGVTDIDIHILPTMSHLSLGTRAGKEPLQTAVQIARQQVRQSPTKRTKRQAQPAPHR